MRRLVPRLWFLVLLGTLLAAPARADLFVIAHPATVIDPEEVFDLFLGGKQFSGSLKLVPVDNLGAREAFLARVLHMTAARYATHWTKKSFRDGSRPPAVKSGDAAVVDYVRRTPGAVGYLRSPPPSGVRLIATLRDGA